MKWEDCRVGDVVLYQILRTDRELNLNTTEISYSSIVDITDKEIKFTDIVSTDMDNLTSCYPLEIDDLNNGILCDDYTFEYTLFEIISLQDKLKQKFPEEFI